MWRGLLKAIHDWNWDEAEVCFQRALDLNPNLVPARVYYAAVVMCPQGRFDEARAHLGTAALLDPASVALEMARGLVLLFVGEWPEAEAAFRRCLALNSEFYSAARMLARVMQAQGRPSEAAVVLQQALPAAGNDLRVLATLGHLRGATGDADGARDALRRLEEAAGSRYVPAFDRAMVHLGLGEHEAAGRLLLEAAAEHEPWLIMLRVDPLFQALAGTEAYQRLDTMIFAGLEQ
jgi:tetratricopeptide (TPR) repeat protein